MLHKEIPFLRIGLPLCAGIVSGLYIKPEAIFLVTVAIVIVTGFLVSLIYNKFQTNQLFGYALTISLFTCGLLLFTKEKTAISHFNPEQTFFYCTISDYPEEKDNSYRLTVKLKYRIKKEGPEAVRGSILLYHKKDSSLNSLLPGDNLIIKCTPVEITNRANPYEFDYRFFMENQGIRYYAYTGRSNIVSQFEPVRRKLIYKALIVRDKIIRMYEKRGITGERLALVAAMTLGQKSMLDQEQKQNFIKAGVMHIMAVSGLHAVILSLFIFNILFFMKRKFNILRIVITLVILWSFAFVTGLTPSVLRATLMFSFLQAGNLMKRDVNGINSILASAFVLILLKPSVIFDAGFLLSYSAVIYIISFYQDFYLKLQFKNRISDKIWQSGVVTIVAQAGTLPLTIMLFNRFPTYFVLTNIIIVPLSSLVIILGCLVPMTFPLQILSQFLALILNYLTGLIELLTAKASSLPLSSLENIGMTVVECILLSVTIFLFSFLMLKKKSFSVQYSICLLIIFLMAGTFIEISTRTSNEIIVYNTPGVSTIGIRSGKILNLYSDTSLASQEVRRHCATLGLKIETSVLKNDIYCIRAGIKKILICNYLTKSTLQKYEPDIVILTGLRPEIQNNLSFRQFTGVLVITSEPASGFRLPRQVDFSPLDTVHLVRKSGGFIRRL